MNTKENTDNREIVSVRLFSTARETVFRAFSDPKHLAQWWGPKGFTNTFQEFDMKPGGKWRFTMHSPSGADYENESKFTEVVKPKKVVFQHLEPVHRFQMTIIFEEQGNKTKLTWRMLFESAEECVKVKSFIIKANEENFDRLENHLNQMTSMENENGRKK